MPHIVLCGRYWRVSGDELPVTAVCAIFGRAIILALLAVVYVATDNDTRVCHDNFQIFLVVSLVTFALSIMCEVVIVYAGLQGTMVEMAKRRKELEQALTTHYCFAVLQLALATWGALLIGDTWSLPCASAVLEQNHTDAVLLTTVVVLQLIDVISQFFCCFLLRAGRVRGRDRRVRGGRPRAHSDGTADGSSAGLFPAEGYNKGGHYSDDDDDDDDDDNDPAYNDSQQKWERRCSSLCKCTRFFSCGIFGGSNIAQDIEAVAKVLTTFFHHDGFLDIVPSDALAGIMLVRLQQRRALTRFFAAQSQGQLSATLPSSAHGQSGSAADDDDNESNGSGSGSGCLSQGSIAAGGGVDEIDALRPPSPPSKRALSESLPMRSMRAMAAPRRQMDPTRCDDVQCIRTLARMSQFAFAIYSHLLYLYDKPVSGLCRLAASCATGSACEAHAASGDLPPPGDNCCAMNHAAVSAVVADMENAETVYASYRNDLVMKPYAVFLDHETELVVVAVRGTLSLEDCLTDVVCDPTEMTDVGKRWGFDGAGRWAHGGMLRSAEAIAQEITSMGILRSLLSGSNSSHSSYENGLSYHSTDSIGSRHVPHYGLMVTGHSLGAGAAVLLSLMLRPAFPTLSCCAFGTPGSLLDTQSAEESMDWLTSVVLNNDVIARVGVSTLNHLREEVLTSITRAKVNKTHIMRSLVEELHPEDVLYPVGQAPENEFKTAVDEFLTRMRARNEHGGLGHELVLPGRVIHLVKVGRGQEPRHRNYCCCMSLCQSLCSCTRKEYVPEETVRQAFSEIVVSPTMAIDHFPDKYVDTLNGLASTWCGPENKCR